MTILNTIVERPDVFKYVLAATVISVFLCCVVHVICDFNYKALIIVAIICAVVSVAYGVFLLPKEPVTKYEVTISDDTSFGEIHDKYNIVEQRGEIWVVSPK